MKVMTEMAFPPLTPSCRDRENLRVFKVKDKQNFKQHRRLDLFVFLIYEVVVSRTIILML